MFVQRYQLLARAMISFLLSVVNVKYLILRRSNLEERVVQKNRVKLSSLAPFIEWHGLLQSDINRLQIKCKYTVFTSYIYNVITFSERGYVLYKRRNSQPNMQNLNKCTIPFLPSLGEQSSAILKTQILGNRATMAGFLLSCRRGVEFDPLSSPQESPCIKNGTRLLIICHFLIDF